jgi:hypothetical protein
MKELNAAISLAKNIDFIPYFSMQIECPRLL